MSALASSSSRKGAKKHGSLRLLFINRSFHPDVEATGQLLTELCVDLAKHHHVSVVAGRPNFVAIPHRQALDAKEGFHGVEVCRVGNIRFSKKSLVGRALGLFTFFLLALWAGLRCRRPSVIIVETDPPFLGALGAFLKRWHRAPLVFYVQDLFPEVGLALGKFRPGLLTSFLRWATQIGLRRADRVVVLGDDMKTKVLARGIKESKIDIVSNWADTDLLKPLTEPNRFRQSLGLADRFLVMYSGNLGLSQNLDPLLEAAGALRGEAIAFLIVGEGAAKHRIESRARHSGLHNVRFLPYQPKEDLAEALSAADVHLIPLRRGLAGYIVPSKLYGILAVGVPYVAAVDGDSDVARITRRFECGLVIEPDSADELVKALGWCLSHRAELTSMGKRGRQAAESDFSRKVCVARFAKTLETVVCPATDATVSASHHSRCSNSAFALLAS